MGLITIAKIAQILLIWQVGLGDDHRFLIIDISDVADELDDGMCLAQVEAGCPRLLPQKAHGIKAKDTNAMINEIQDDADELFKKERIGKIKINLVLAESTPDPSFSSSRCYRLQQCMFTRADDIRDVKILIDRQEIAAARCLAIDKLSEPRTGSGPMVQDDIGHDFQRG